MNEKELVAMLKKDLERLDSKELEVPVARERVKIAREIGKAHGRAIQAHVAGLKDPLFNLLGNQNR